jgi:hypothetical protein
MRIRDLLSPSAWTTTPAVKREAVASQPADANANAARESTRSNPDEAT